MVPPWRPCAVPDLGPLHCPSEVILAAPLQFFVGSFRSVALPSPPSSGAPAVHSPGGVGGLGPLLAHSAPKPGPLSPQESHLPWSSGPCGMLSSPLTPGGSRGVTTPLASREGPPEGPPEGPKRGSPEGGPRGVPRGGPGGPPGGAPRGAEISAPPDFRKFPRRAPRGPDRGPPGGVRGDSPGKAGNRPRIRTIHIFQGGIPPLGPPWGPGPPGDGGDLGGQKSAHFFGYLITLPVGTVLGPPPGPPLTGWPRQDPQNWPPGRAPGVIGRGYPGGYGPGTQLDTSWDPSWDPGWDPAATRLPSEMGAWREPIGWSGKGGSLRRDPLRLFSAMGGTWRPGRAPPSKRWAEAQRREPRMREGGAVCESQTRTPPGSVRSGRPKPARTPRGMRHWMGKGPGGAPPLRRRTSVGHWRPPGRQWATWPQANVTLDTTKPRPTIPSQKDPKKGPRGGRPGPGSAPGRWLRSAGPYFYSGQLIAQ